MMIIDGRKTLDPMKSIRVRGELIFAVSFLVYSSQEMISAF
jgi:hypothetical protein